MEQEKRRTDNSTVLLLTQRPGERPTVIITTPAIGSLPPRPVLMFSCVDNITRMQVALTHPRTENDIPVSLVLEGRAVSFALVCAGKRHAAGIQPGPAGIEEIRQLFGAKTLTLDTGADKKLTFNIDGLAQIIAPLRDACHWAGDEYGYTEPGSLAVSSAGNCRKTNWPRNSAMRTRSGNISTAKSLNLARWPTASLISRKSSVRGWCFWRQKARIFAC
jgi:type VI secretion system VasI family protein